MRLSGTEFRIPGMCFKCLFFLALFNLTQRPKGKKLAKVIHLVHVYIVYETAFIYAHIIKLISSRQCKDPPLKCKNYQSSSIYSIYLKNKSRNYYSRNASMFPFLSFVASKQLDVINFLCDTCARDRCKKKHYATLCK